MMLNVDIDFKNILPPLTTQEYMELEKSIKEKGVLSPILVWNGYIVDGHNRYEICTTNRIDNFPIKEVEFNNKEEVLEWILSNQLGRRNLTDFQRNEVALKYQDVIAKRMKEKQGTRTDLKHLGHLTKKLDEEPTTTRKELSKIAGTSESSIKRTKYILDNGTDEQIERARKGGSGNSIGTIEREIKETIAGEKKCNKCGKILSLSDFYPSHKTICKKCYDSWSCKTVDLKGRTIRISDEYRGLTEEQIVGDLYDTEKEIDYTSDDLKEEISAIIGNFEWSLSNSLEMHRDLLNGEDAREKVSEKITELQTKIEGLKTLYGFV